MVHKELLDRARRTETKLTTLISALGMTVPVDGKASCEVSMSAGVMQVSITAADTPISAIKASLIKSGYDPSKLNNVRILLDGKEFSHVNFY